MSEPRRPRSHGLTRAEIDDLIRLELEHQRSAPGDDPVDDPASILGRVRVLARLPDDLQGVRLAASEAGNAAKSRDAARRRLRALELQAQDKKHAEIARIISKEEGLADSDAYSRETVRKWIRQAKARPTAG